jgi:integral membrane protein
VSADTHAGPGAGHDARLRRLAWAEGTSLLLLLGVAMPLKYAAGLPAATRVMGLVHGLCFLLYLVAVLDALGTKRLSGRGARLALAAALVPGGTFVLASRLGRATAAPTPTGERAGP